MTITLTKLYKFVAPIGSTEAFIDADGGTCLYNNAYNVGGEGDTLAELQAVATSMGITLVAAVSTNPYSATPGALYGCGYNGTYSLGNGTNTNVQTWTQLVA
jgi:hypothetical protein